MALEPQVASPWPGATKNKGVCFYFSDFFFNSNPVINPLLMLHSQPDNETDSDLLTAYRRVALKL